MVKGLGRGSEPPKLLCSLLLCLLALRVLYRSRGGTRKGQCARNPVHLRAFPGRALLRALLRPLRLEEQDSPWVLQGLVIAFHARGIKPLHILLLSLHRF